MDIVIAAWIDKGRRAFVASLIRPTAGVVVDWDGNGWEPQFGYQQGEASLLPECFSLSDQALGALGELHDRGSEGE